jgi:tRNA(fMet)-specific endonuclease VapC
MAAFYLLDTTTFSELMRDHPKVASRITALVPAERVCICTIVRGEILYGLEQLPTGRRQAELSARAAGLFPTLRCESIPESAADQFAKLKRSLEKKGLALGENDLWIAATAMAIGAVLVTQDSDFRKIGGLAVQDWTR